MKYSTQLHRHTDTQGDETSFVKIKSFVNLREKHKEHKLVFAPMMQYLIVKKLLYLFPMRQQKIYPCYKNTAIHIDLEMYPLAYL